MISPSSRALARAAVLSLALVASNAALAGDWLGVRDEAFNDPSYEFKIDGELTAGMLSGTSHELFYDPLGSGHKYSELIWTMDDVAIISGKVSLKPSHWWSVDLSGATNVTQEATMDDYDWLDLTRPNDWTHWSHHNKTHLERALMFDLSTKLALWRTSFFDLKGIAGYRWDKFDWTAYGGSFIYSTPGNFRDDIFDLPPSTVGIEYIQEFRTPYLGLGGELRLGDFALEGTVTGSWWATMDSRDSHFLRFLQWQDSYDGGTMLQYDIEGRYKFSDTVTFKAGWKHLEFDEMKAPTRVSIIGGPGIVYYPGDTHGADHESNQITAGVVYSFY